MNSLLTSTAVCASLLAAICLGSRLRRMLPEHHLSSDSKDAVKLSMGLIATMTALLLGLLVSSAKNAYDTVRAGVVQMSAKAAMLDRVLEAYGPQAADARARYHAVYTAGVNRMWSDEGRPGTRTLADTMAAASAYDGIQKLSPGNELQQALKAEAIAMAMQTGELRGVITAQAAPAVSRLMLVVVAGWLVVIFVGFTIVSPPNTTVVCALVAAALSVSIAMFLVLELDRPFGGLIQLPKQEMLNVLNHAAS